jgi:hypothetical protein
MLKAIAIVFAFIGFVPQANVPSTPIKQEVIRQPMLSTEQAFYNISNITKKRGRK